MALQMIEPTGAELRTEAFGNLGRPPILLLMETSASTVW